MEIESCQGAPRICPHAGGCLLPGNDKLCCVTLRNPIQIWRWSGLWSQTSAWGCRARFTIDCCLHNSVTVGQGGSLRVPSEFINSPWTQQSKDTTGNRGHMQSRFLFIYFSVIHFLQCVCACSHTHVCAHVSWWIGADLRTLVKVSFVPPHRTVLNLHCWAW